ncbi:MAG: metal ABC transporter ATP-binding protein [Dehalococcoidia bacterium]|nr:metal ABC transporter ATP-binding protein [Dehalococcoidia bacterium]MCA9830134.1 metal ABC transporter ATP-binding protein [Dehalococcoidia bacterium]MCB9485795.1 metal ABC transporter ATP-binding protein [Thermoflexaceae bacterium]
MNDGLVIDDLVTGFGTTFVLGGVSLAAPPRSVVGLIGPNGSGKSTLLKAIAGVLPLRRGKLTLDGKPLRSQPLAVAFVPQREQVNWDFPVTAFDVVLMGRYRRAGWIRRPGRKDRELALAAMATLGLAGMEHRHISEFSGGQQQRIFLARAVAQEPRLVLLDEPFTGVDAENRQVLHRVIADLAAGGTIVMMATHDLDEVTTTCSHVAALRGRLVAFGKTKDTFTAPIIRATFGGQVAVVPA